MGIILLIVLAVGATQVIDFDHAQSAALASPAQPTVTHDVSQGLQQGQTHESSRGYLIANLESPKPSVTCESVESADERDPAIECDIVGKGGE